jgi:hypothetical protein
MKAATAVAKGIIPDVTPRQALWLDFYRALGSRNFVRAAALARRLGIDEERIKRIERDALRQFIAEYQNCSAAARLCADYCITAEEFVRLTEEILGRKEFESSRTFTLRSGKPAHLSIAEQIRSFATRQIEILAERERRGAGRGGWSRLVSVAKSWLNRLSNPWQGGFPHSGPAYG